MELCPGFQEVTIDADINPAVEAIWTYYTDRALTHRIAPDGRFDLVFRFDVTATGRLQGVRPIVAAASMIAQDFSVQAHQGAIGVRLSAGAASSLFARPLAAMSGGWMFDAKACEVAPWVVPLCRDYPGVSAFLSALLSRLSALECRVPPSMLTEALALIHNAAGQVRVNDIAGQFQTTERTVGRHFHQGLGLSPKQYISILRLRQASLALHDHTATVADVAAMYGYSDQAHLTRAFKTGLGVTPVQARRCFGQEILL